MKEDYLNSAKIIMDRNPSNVEQHQINFAQVLALIAIAEQLQRLNDKLDMITHYSDAININKLG